jgi:hypothetical protein
MLRLLARDGVEARITHQNLGRTSPPCDVILTFLAACRRRGAEAGLPRVPAGFTRTKRRQMVDGLMRRGIDGNDGSVLGLGSPDIQEGGRVNGSPQV